MAEQKFIYSETYGKLRDFFGTFVNALKHHDINEIILDKTNPADSFLSESFSRLSDALTPYRSELELFAYINETGISFILSLVMDKLVECSSINEAIKILRDLDSKKLRYDALTFFDRDLSNPIQLYNELLSSEQLIITYIIALNLPVNIKYHLIRFINTPDAMMSELVNCLSYYAPIFEDEYSSLYLKLSSSSTVIKKAIETNPRTFLKDNAPHYYEWFSIKPINTIILSLWCYMPTCTDYYKADTTSTSCYILFGYIHINRTDLSPVFYDNTTDIFNTFSSIEKYRVFKLLAMTKNDISAAEIAEKLEIASPTLAHYLRAMCDSGLVLKISKGRKVFYNISISFFEHAQNYIYLQKQLCIGGRYEK